MNPENTFAIIVGIEEYRLDGLALTGPASDCVKFAEWLHEKKVPPRNILFFHTLSSAASESARIQQLSARLQALEIEVAEASTANIRNALVNHLPKLNVVSPRAGQPDDSLFYFFWSGHGVVDGFEDQCVLCQEVTLNDQCTFKIKDVMRQMRMKSRSKFQRQIFVVDACATAYQEMFEGSASLAHQTFSDSDADLDLINKPKQNLLCAVSPNQAAINDNLNRTGKFSWLFLDALKTLPSDVVLQDITQVGAFIRNGYEELAKEENVTSLVPRIVYFGEVPYYPRQEGETAQAAKMKSRIWEQLRTLEISVKDLHLAYLDTIGMGQIGKAEKTLAGMIGHLSSTSRDGVPGVLEFVARIAAQDAQQNNLEQGGLDQLNQWLDEWFKTDSTLGIPDLIRLREQIRAGEFKPPYHLLIDVPYPQKGKLIYWLLDSSGKQRGAHGQRVGASPSDEVNVATQKIGEAIRNILREPNIVPFTGEGDLGIEIFVSEQLFDLALDQWPDPHSRVGRLGERYRVALRWRERAKGIGKYGGICQKWRDFIKKLNLKPDIRWVAKDELLEDLSGELFKRDYQTACLGFPFNPVKQSDPPLLVAALEEGIPFVLWVRSEVAGWEDYRQELLEQLKKGDLSAAPACLQDLRSRKLSDKNHPSRFLTVFWDDPRRLPKSFQGGLKLKQPRKA